MLAVCSRPGTRSAPSPWLGNLTFDARKASYVVEGLADLSSDRIGGQRHGNRSPAQCWRGIQAGRYLHEVATPSSRPPAGCERRLRHPRLSAGLPSFVTAKLVLQRRTFVSLNLTLGLALLTPASTGNQSNVAAGIDTSFNAGITPSRAALRSALRSPPAIAAVRIDAAFGRSGDRLPSKARFRLSDPVPGVDARSVRRRPQRDRPAARTARRWALRRSAKSAARRHRARLLRQCSRRHR